MKQKEFVYLYISTKMWKEKKKKLTQKQIADELKISLSTVHNALQPLKKMYAVKIQKRCFILKDFEKLMVYWATLRDVKKDTIYSTFYAEEPLKSEASMPSDVLFTGYSGYRILTGDSPADYSEIYVYSSNIKEIKKRFPERNGPKNIFVLKYDKKIEMFNKNGCVSLPLIFVDLWNLPEWYSYDFIKEAKKRLFYEG